jgi:Imidazoleglycerol-phosphate dehydratase
MKNRVVTVERDTKETQITMTFNLDGGGKCDCSTGIGFFDHMLCGFAKHGLFDLTLQCKGDLQVDTHHSIEDIGIVLGEAIKAAVGDKKGIKRYGHFILPMDETLILCALDLSGRPCYVSDVRYTAERIGELETEMFAEFFYAISYSAAMNLHFKKISGENNHHIAEACFKAFAKALDMATSHEPRLQEVWSTKGSL